MAGQTSAAVKINDALAQQHAAWQNIHNDLATSIAQSPELAANMQAVTDVVRGLATLIRDNKDLITDLTDIGATLGRNAVKWQTAIIPGLDRTIAALRLLGIVTDKTADNINKAVDGVEKIKPPAAPTINPFSFGLESLGLGQADRGVLKQRLEAAKKARERARLDAALLTETIERQLTPATVEQVQKWLDLQAKIENTTVKVRVLKEAIAGLPDPNMLGIPMSRALAAFRGEAIPGAGLGFQPGALRGDPFSVQGLRGKGVSPSLLGGLDPDLAKQLAEVQADFNNAGKEAQKAGAVVVSSFGAMAQAAIRGSQQMEAAMVNAITQIVRALPGVGPLGGAIVGAVGGILSAVFARDRQKPRPVSVQSFGSDAERVLQDRDRGPDRVTVVIQQQGRTIEEIEYDLGRRTRRDAVVRIPAGVDLGEGG